MALLGNYVLDREIAVATTSLVDVCGQVGISEQATRSTLARMARRDLVLSHRSGRRAYLALTQRGAEILRNGRRWLTEPLALPWDGRWTVVAVTLPTGKEAERHALRSRLIWSGFGGLSNGLWIAPHGVDVAESIAGLGLDAHIRAFAANTLAPTTPGQLIADAYDLEKMRARYEQFLFRWVRPSSMAPDALAQRLLIYTDWLQIARDNPRLPIEFLPDAWPGLSAEATFHRLTAALEADASREAAELMDVIEIREPTKI